MLPRATGRLWNFLRPKLTAGAVSFPVNLEGCRTVYVFCCARFELVETDEFTVCERLLDTQRVFLVPGESMGWECLTVCSVSVSGGMTSLWGSSDWGITCNRRAVNNITELQS